MKTLPPQISDAERAVNAYKHELLVRVMAVIVRAAMARPYVSAGDVPEDIVEKQHRQGVASNAWNALRSRMESTPSACARTTSRAPTFSAFASPKRRHPTCSSRASVPSWQAT